MGLGQGGVWEQPVVGLGPAVLSFVALLSTEWATCGANNPTDSIKDIT